MVHASMKKGGLRKDRVNHEDGFRRSVAIISFALSRLCRFPSLTQGLCPGLHSCAASRLPLVAVTSLNAGYGRVTISLGLVGSTNFRPRSWLTFNVAGTSRSAICIFRVHDPVVQ